MTLPRDCAEHVHGPVARRRLMVNVSVWGDGRRGLRRALWLPLIILVVGCHPAMDVDHPRVMVGDEVLVGEFGRRYHDIRSFKAIPYARPPVGELRWTEPQGVSPRAGVRMATRYSPACFQDDYNTVWYRRVGAAFGAAPGTFRDPPFSEDCLYLNLWAPASVAHRRRPVIVWIHGGSNKAGWSFEPNYDGEALAARGDVVVVTMAYRLGVFGFFSHPELGNGQAPANFGLLDQLMALRWIKDHIADFGGDPDNVTVAGESAGAADIAYLIASPRAKGLFTRAISESGGYVFRETPSLPSAQSDGLRLANSLPGAPRLDGLKRLSAAEVWAAAKAIPGSRIGPVIDGQVVLEPLSSAFAHNGIGVDLLIGSNANEFLMYASDDARALDALLAGFPPVAREELRWLSKDEGSAQAAQDRIRSLVEMACPAYLMADTARTSGHAAFVYRFARIRPGPGGRALGAYHGAEVPYVFDTHDYWLTADSSDATLTAEMIGYWSRFARAGDPNAGDFRAWPRWDGDAARVLLLDAANKAISAPDWDVCRRLRPALYPIRS